MANMFNFFLKNLFEFTIESNNIPFTYYRRKNIFLLLNKKSRIFRSLYALTVYLYLFPVRQNCTKARQHAS